MEERVNQALRKHQTACQDWDYQDLVRFLHVWTDRFISVFKLEISVPALRIDYTYPRALGTYRIGRNGFGLKDEITFNTSHLDRPKWAVLVTLMHELVHEWQHTSGSPGKSNRWNYHNKEFREKALEYGLVVDQFRHTRLTEGKLTALLRENGVEVSGSDLDPLPRSFSGFSPKRSKLRKWSCACEPRPVNVWAAVEVDAVCQRCGAKFRRSDAN